MCLFFIVSSFGCRFVCYSLPAFIKDLFFIVSGRVSNSTTLRVVSSKQRPLRLAVAKNKGLPQLAKFDPDRVHVERRVAVECARCNFAAHKAHWFSEFRIGGPAPPKCNNYDNNRAPHGLSPRPARPLAATRQ